MSEPVCPHCGKPVSATSKYCPSCGRDIQPQPIPPATTGQFPVEPPVTWAPPSRSRTSLIIGIVVIAMLVIGIVAGTWVWGNMAAGGLTLTCLTSSSSNSSTTATISIEVGIQNPSVLDVSSDWTIAIIYPSVSFSSEQAFTTPAGGTSHPIFTFTINQNQASQATGTPTVTITAVDHVLVYAYSHSATASGSTTSSSPPPPSC